MGLLEPIQVRWGRDGVNSGQDSSPSLAHTQTRQPLILLTPQSQFKAIVTLFVDIRQTYILNYPLHVTQ